MREPPHAPYRSGAPTFTPTLRPISPSRWLTPDTEAHCLDWKRALLAHPERVLRVAEAGFSAADEAAGLIGEALGSPCSDLLGASALVSDDLVVMSRVGDDWICSALTLTAPTFFSIDDAFGKDLTALHGPVPDGMRLAQRIGRVFTGLRPGVVLERFNWTLQCGSDRHTPDGARLRARAIGIRPEEAAAALFLRVERQTIRRLPETGAVLFTIRVCLDPLCALPAQDHRVFADAWRTLHNDGRAYKHWNALNPLLNAVFKGWSV